jgi:hypothetical protein
MADRRSIWARDVMQFVAFVTAAYPGVDGRELAGIVGIVGLDALALDAKLPVGKLWALWRAAVDATGDRTLAVRYGIATRLEHMGVFGVAVMTAPTSRIALERAARYLHLSTDSARLKLVEREDSCHVRWVRDGARDAGHALANETVLAQIVAAIRQVAGDGAATEVAFRHARPGCAEATAIAKLFGCATTWSARHDQIAVRSTALDRLSLLERCHVSEDFVSLSLLERCHLARTSSTVPHATTEPLSMRMT